MCQRSLIARGVRAVRPSPREDKPTLLVRDDDEVARKKDINRGKAQRPEKMEKRARRRRAKIEWEGMRNLRQMKLM